MQNQVKRLSAAKLLVGLSAVLLLFLCVVFMGGTKASALKSPSNYDIVPQSGTKVDLSVTVTKYYNRAYTMLDAVNAKRTELGMSTCVMDADLMERAMERAAELLIYDCTVRTDGTLFCNTDNGGEMNSVTSLTNAPYIVSQWLNDVEGYANMTSDEYTKVGIGCVYSSGYYAYAVFMVEGNSNEPSTVPSNSMATYNLKVDKAYLAKVGCNLDEGFSIAKGNTVYMMLTVQNLGFTSLKMPVAASSVNYSSSNTGVLGVSSTGVLTANSVGKTLVMAKLKSDATIYCSREITVVPSNISVITVEPIPDQTYTGSEIKPSIIVRDGATVLKEGTDYTLTFKNNIEVGTATVYVTGINNYNSVVTANFNIVKGVNKVTATISISSTGWTGDAITLQGAASGAAAPYTYTFSVKKPGSSSYTVFSGPSTSSRCSYTPSSAGTYSFKVLATDSNGLTGEKSINVSVTKKPLNAAISLSSSSAAPQSSITIQTSVSNAAGTVYYTYQYKKSSDSSWTTIKSKSTAKSYTWTIPAKSGSYIVRAVVTDGTTTLYPTANLTVQASTISFKSASISATEVKPSTVVTLKAEMQNGFGSYTYAFFYKKSTDSAYTVLQSYSTANTATFKTAATGKYMLLIRGKDNSGTVVQESFTLVVSNMLQNKSTVSATSVVRNATVTMKGKAADGSSPYQYAYLAKGPNDSSYTVLKNYSTSTSYQWSASATGTYMLMVKVKDSTGTAVSKTFTVTVKDGALANTSTVSTATLTRGEYTILTGKATGGVGTYQYAIAARHESSSNYTTVKAYDTTAKYTWTPAKSGTYTVVVKVKDGNGTIVQKFFTIKVTAADLINKTTVSAASVALGKSVTFTGSALGGVGAYQYAFVYRLNTESTYTVALNYSKTAAYTWTPKAKGTYIVIAKVKDTNGTVVQKTFTITVT